MCLRTRPCSCFRFVVRRWKKKRGARHGATGQNPVSLGTASILRLLDASFGDSTATKFRRILRYFQFGKTESSSEARTILSQALAGGEESSAAVLMLVAHFKEQQDKMFINVDDTAIGVDVDTTKLKRGLWLGGTA